MSSKIDICSMALAAIGVEPAVDLDNPTKEGERYCKLFWDHCVRLLLSKHDWKFAREYKVLDGTLALSESPSAEYDHAYQFPSDLLVLRYLWDAEAEERITDDEYEVHGKSILTNLDDVSIVYTKNYADIGNYPDWFVEALIPLLASKLAPKLADKDKAREMKEDYKQALAEAVERDNSQNNYPIDMDKDTWLQAAGVGSNVDSTDESEVIYVESD